jgi:hypothetical protein
MIKPNKYNQTKQAPNQAVPFRAEIFPVIIKF